MLDASPPAPSRARSILIVLFLAVVLLPSQAWSFQVYEDDTYEFDVGGIARTGYGVATDAHPRLSGPFLNHARLSGRARYKGMGHVFVHLEGASGTVQMLDTIATLEPLDFWQLRAGYFRAAFSEEFLSPLATLRFPDRGLLTSLGPRRHVGVDTTLRAPIGSVTTLWTVGAFNPFGLERQEGGGQLLVGRGQLRLPWGLSFAVAWSEHVGMDRAIEEGDPAVVRHGRLLDVSAVFDNGRTYAHAEAVAAPRHLFDDGFGSGPLGVYVAAGHRLGDIATEVTFEPVVSYDFLREGDETDDLHRVRGGVNVYLLDHRIMPGLFYELVHTAPTTGHAVLLQLQMVL